MEANRLDPEETSAIVKFVSNKPDAFGFRQLEAGLIEKMMPYLCADGDYVRCVADHIACMTDASAEEEVRNLYY